MRPTLLAVTVWVVVPVTVTAALAGCGGGATRRAATAPVSSASSASTAPASTAVPAAPAAPGVPAPPASTARSATGAAKLAQAQRTHEYPTPVLRQRVIGGWRSAVQAVQVFATTYVNWSAGTIAARLHALAQVSVGQARSAMALAAAQAPRDYELARGGIANSGVVEAIAPVLGHPHEYAVVTREQTTASHTDAYRGLAPAWHLALATVTEIRGGLWVLSAWQPEN